MTETPQSNDLNRILQILMKKNTPNVINLTPHSRDHAEGAVPAYTESIIILFIIAEFLYVLISLVPNSPSCAIVTDTLPRHFMIVNTDFYI